MKYIVTYTQTKPIINGSVQEYHKTENVLGIYDSKEEGMFERKKMQQNFKDQGIKSYSMSLTGYEDELFNIKNTNNKLYIINEFYEKDGEEFEDIIGIFSEKEDILKFKNNPKYEINTLYFVDNLNILENKYK